MRPYFEQMATIGHELRKGEVKRSMGNVDEIKACEEQLEKEVDNIKKAGIPEAKMNARGQLTIWQRINVLVDEGSFIPLHTLYNPMDNPEGSTNVFDGLARISGKWVVVIGFDNKVLAGAWLPGQSENILRVTDLSKRINIPLVWIVNCSGAKLPEQEKFYANRRGAGTPFFRHAELAQLGIPVLAGIYGTNPAGGGYQSISPAVLFAHKDCNIAVGGAGIVSGMTPKGFFDRETAEDLIDKTRHFRAQPPGTVKTHYDETGFFRYVYEEEKDVLLGIREFMKKLPAYDPEVFRVAEPKAPGYNINDLYNIVPMSPKKIYDIEEVIARLGDGGEFSEFRPGYGPEVVTGLCKIDGFLTAVIANRQGYLGKDYPEYADYPGIGGKLYRQGLIKMNEFVTLCGRDRIPIIWIQDTSGIDVGDTAEKAELLGLGQSLVYSIQSTDIPMMLIVLRKGTAAAHYLMGGPTANRQNAFSIGTAATEIQVMHGETAAVATYSRRLVKEKDSGGDIDAVIDAMNRLAEDYYIKSRPAFCAKTGLVDEIVPMSALRKYLEAFAGACYQNPKSFCPHHQMILPRIIKG